MNEKEKNTCTLHTARIDQILEDIQEIKNDMREMKSERKDDLKDFYQAFNKLRESITGNAKEGLTVRVDRNTEFRKNLSKLLWALFTPLYGGLIIILVKIAYDTFSR